jgi:hypothetical protein
MGEKLSHSVSSTNHTYYKNHKQSTITKFSNPVPAKVSGIYGENDEA